MNRNKGDYSAYSLISAINHLDVLIEAPELNFLGLRFIECILTPKQRAMLRGLKHVMIRKKHILTIWKKQREEVVLHITHKSINAKM